MLNLSYCLWKLNFRLNVKSFETQSFGLVNFLLCCSFWRNSAPFFSKTALTAHVVCKTLLPKDCFCSYSASSFPIRFPRRQRGKELGNAASPLLVDFVYYLDFSSFKDFQKLLCTDFWAKQNWKYFSVHDRE